MEYLDFELEIGEGEGRVYPLEVVRSPAGERRATMNFPFDELELENHLLRVQNALLSGGSTRRRIASTSTQTVETFGSALYDSLIVGDVRTAFELSRHEAGQQGKGLRIKLRINDPALAALPWEFLYDRSQGEFVALSSHTPIVRYLDLPRSIQPLPVTPPLRILGMICSPDDLPPLNVEREKLRVERALGEIQEKGTVELTWISGGSWRDLQRAMRKGPWHILHFVGHGRFDVNRDEGCLAFVGEQGETDELTASQIGVLLADHRSLRLVMLNACEGARGGRTDVFSGTAATLVRRGIPAVVAMQYEITDRAAIEFARTFYDAIADEMPLDTAVAEARKTVSLEIDDTVEWATPVLFMRSPDGVLFKVHGPAAPPQVPIKLPEPLPEPPPEPLPELEPMPNLVPAPELEPVPEPKHIEAPIEPVQATRSAPAPAPAPQPQPQPINESSAQFTFTGTDGELLVSSDWVKIRRGPPFKPNKRRPDRLEPMERLTGVHLFEATAVGRGFIQLCFAGEGQDLETFWTMGSSRNTVQFTQLQQARFASARQWLDYYRSIADPSKPTEGS